MQGEVAFTPKGLAGIYLGPRFRYRKQNERVVSFSLSTLTGVRSANNARLAHKVEVLGRRRYTSVADVELTTKLARLEWSDSPVRASAAN